MSINVRSFNGESGGTNGITFSTYEQCNEALQRLSSVPQKFKGVKEIAVCATNFRVRLQLLSLNSRGRVTQNEVSVNDLTECIKREGEINGH